MSKLNAVTMPIKEKPFGWTANAIPCFIRPGRIL